MAAKSLLEYYYPQSPPERLADLFDGMDIPDPRGPATILRLQEGITFEREPVPARVRRAVMERDGFACRSCGSRRRLQVDHIMQVSVGGGSHPVNLRVLCSSCNGRRGNKDADRWTATALPIVGSCCECSGTASGALDCPTAAYCVTCGRAGLAESDCCYRHRQADARLDMLSWNI